MTSSMSILSILLVLPVIARAAVSPPQQLSPLSARSSAHHPLVVPAPLTIWCSTDSAIKKATFTRSGDDKKLPGKITGMNATLTLESATVLDAGDYKCELDTQRGKKTETTSVFVRPVVHTDHPEKLEAKEGDEFNLETTAQTVVEGQEVVLTCPVHGHPKPKVKWMKDKKPIRDSKTLSVKDREIRISAADYSHEGSYQCDAINEFTVASKTSRPLVSVAKYLYVKSQYAWLWPLLVILAILTLLIIIIFACELRRKKREKLMTAYIQETD